MECVTCRTFAGTWVPSVHCAKPIASMVMDKYTQAPANMSWGTQIQTCCHVLNIFMLRPSMTKKNLRPAVWLRSLWLHALAWWFLSWFGVAVHLSRWHVAWATINGFVLGPTSLPRKTFPTIRTKHRHTGFAKTPWIMNNLQELAQQLWCGMFWNSQFHSPDVLGWPGIIHEHARIGFYAANEFAPKFLRTSCTGHPP